MLGLLGFGASAACNAASGADSRAAVKATRMRLVVLFIGGDSPSHVDRQPRSSWRSRLHHSPLIIISRQRLCQNTLTFRHPPARSTLRLTFCRKSPRLPSRKSNPPEPVRKAASREVRLSPGSSTKQPEDFKSAVSCGVLLHLAAFLPRISSRPQGTLDRNLARFPGRDRRRAAPPARNRSAGSQDAGHRRAAVHRPPSTAHPLTSFLAAAAILAASTRM